MNSPGVVVRRQRGISRARFLLIVAALILLPAIAYVFLQMQYRGQSAPGHIDFTGNEVAIERGRYLALVGNCASCHTAADGGYMAGGVPFETPFGRIYSTNITPDEEAGIGSWSGEEFFNSMRLGIRPGGVHLYPAFPYTSFTRVSDDDIAAIYAYLQTVPASSFQSPVNDLSFPFDQRWLLVFWKGLFFDAGVYEADPAMPADWNRGAYLVEALAHCGACHTPRNLLGAEKEALAMTGGEYTDKVPGGGVSPWFAPNLTSAKNGLGMWPAEELVSYLKTGLNQYVETFGPMNEVILNSTRHVDDDDIAAMATYLKSLPAGDVEPDPPASSNVLGMGRTVYNLHCGTCHLPTGLGDEESAPRLANGSLIVQARNPASLINVILYGPQLPDPPLPTKRREPMDEFQYLLSDQEVAAVASYVRANWGNTGGEVTAEQVARQRQAQSR